MMKIRMIGIVFCLLLPFYGMAYKRDANELETLQNNDTIAQKTTWIKSLLDYFAKSDNPDPTKKFDFGLICGPHYSSDVGLGLGIVASGLYSTDRADTLLPKSNVSVYADLTTKAFLLIGVRGNHVFPQKRYRIDYKLYVYSFPTYFWGIGYDKGKENSNESEYRRLKMEFLSRFLFRIGENSYVGPIVDIQFVRGSKLELGSEPLWEGEELCLRTNRVGLSYTYDSRDFMLNASRGWFIQLDQLFAPGLIGNDHVFNTTDLTACTYRTVWKGGVLAGEFHSCLNGGDVPWALLAAVGGDSRMRGYYEGRYRDKNLIEAQVELRQHIWHRNGAVCWVGAANVFPKWSALKGKKTLLNAGIGYRWEFKEKVNVRLDLGLTRNGPGFLFNINEAF